jgi:hypothetical protein
MVSLSRTPKRFVSYASHNIYSVRWGKSGSGVRFSDEASKK